MSGAAGARLEPRIRLQGPGLDDLGGRQRVLYVFAWATRLGVPISTPKTQRTGSARAADVEKPIAWMLEMQQNKLDAYVAATLLANRAYKRLFVWDWQSDGMRMRCAHAAGRAGTSIEWSEPQNFWLRKM